MIALLSALVTGCAILTPLYQRALDQASVAVELDRAPAGATALRLTSIGILSNYYSGEGAAVAALTPEQLDDRVPASLRRSFSAAVAARFVRVAIPAGQPHSSDGPLVWREGVCDHLAFTAGRCPSGAGEIAVSTADAANFGWAPGARVGVHEIQPQEIVTPAIAKVLTVSGIYSTPEGRYWEGWPLTGSSGSKPAGEAVQHDTWITDEAAFTNAPLWRNPSSQVDMHLDRTVTGIDELLRLGPALTAFARSQARGAAAPAVVVVRTGLPSLADTVRQGHDQSRVTVPALMVPLGILGVVVLWMALGTAAEQRRPEVAVARLRGRGVRGAQAHLVQELLTVVLAGVPIGALVAVGLSWLARRSLLPGGVPFELRLPVWSALVLAVVVLTTTTLLVTRQLSREPIAVLLRRVPVRRTGWALGTADAVVVTVAASILGAFATGRLTGPVALAAPAVLALALGLVISRAATPLAARTGRRLVHRGRTAGGVALLQLARRPGTRGTVVLLTVSAAILVFAGDAVAVGARNRDLDAAQQVGAPMVATVSGGTLLATQEAIAAAKVPADDVTAVVVQHPPSDDDQTTFFVDPKAFGDIAAFPDRSDARRALRRLTPPTAEPIAVVGSRLTLDVATQSFYEDAKRPVELVVELVQHDGALTSHTLGRLAPGTSAARTVTVEVDCATGCVLTGWRLVTDPANPGAGRVTVGAMRTEHGRVSLGPATDWPARETDGGGVRALNASAGALELFVDNPGTSELLLQHRWVPASLPAVVSGTLPADSDGRHFEANGLDGVTRPMTSVARLAWLPAAGQNAAVSDLRLAARTGAELGDDAELQVWFADEGQGTLDRVTDALEDRGLAVTRVTRVSDVRDRLEESAASWSLQLGVLVGIAGLLVACLGLMIAAAAAWRNRTRDLAVLRMNGMSAATTRRISIAEQLPTIIAAVLAGAAGGVLAAHYALPTLPLLPSDPQVDLVDLSAAWPAVFLMASTTLVTWCGVGWLLAAVAARRATLDRVVGAS